MNVKSKISFSLIFIILLTAFPFPACDDISSYIVDCSECYVEEPEYAEIEVRITLNEENNLVPITSYYGDYEDNRIAYVDTAFSSTLYIFLPVNEEYTLVASYKKNGLDYFVINGVNPKTRIDYDSCDETCYYIVNDEVDLRMKF